MPFFLLYIWVNFNQFFYESLIKVNLKKSQPSAFPVEETSQSDLVWTPHSSSPINSIIRGLSLSKFRHDPEITIIGGFSAYFLFNATDLKFTAYAIKVIWCTESCYIPCHLQLDAIHQVINSIDFFYISFNVVLYHTMYP